MRPIPLKMRKEMSEDPWYKTCCLSNGTCYGKIDWHHVIIHAGRQLNEKWAIVPACQIHHRKAAQLYDKFLHIAVNRATIGELLAISKAIDYIREKERLNKKYGIPKFSTSREVFTE